ncbi:MAG TPA: hypothetical protein VH701_02950, partial [Vicinamibacterales bacterium]
NSRDVRSDSDNHEAFPRTGAAAGVHPPLFTRPFVLAAFANATLSLAGLLLVPLPGVHESRAAPYGGNRGVDRSRSQSYVPGVIADLRL